MPLATAVLVSACAEPAPPISAATEADMAANAVEQACDEYGCDSPRIYIRGHLFARGTTSGRETEMQAQMREAIVQELGNVEFVSPDEAHELFGEDWLVDGGQGVLITVGPTESLASDVVGIEVGVVTARDGGHGAVFQFKWDGDQWVPATSGETGVTVTSWVS